MVKTDAKKSPTIITVVESKFRNKRRSLSVSLHRQAAAIGADGDQALLVGAEDVGVMLLQAFNDGGVRVAVAVLKTVGDDGEGGGDGAEELFGAGGPAAVVGHFEHVDVLELVRIQHLALDLALHVAGEQEAAAAIAYAQNQGIVVLRLVVGDVVRKRGEHFDLGASEWEAARGLEGDDAGVYGCGLLADGLPDGALGGSAGPDFPGVEIGDQGGESADMVVVGVGHGDDVQAAEAAFPEIGRDYIFTDIELRGGPTAKSGDAAAIEEHALAIREDHQQAVALAHVDGRHLQFAGVDFGRERVPEQQRQGSGYSDDRCDAPPAAARQGTGDERGGERYGQPERRRGDAPVWFDIGVPRDHFLR